MSLTLDDGHSHVCGSDYGKTSLPKALEQLQNTYSPFVRLYASSIAIERCEAGYTRYLRFRQYGVGSYTIYGKTRNHDQDAKDYGYIPITEVSMQVLAQSCQNLFVDRYLSGRGFAGAEHLALLKGVQLLRQAAEVFGTSNIPDIGPRFVGTVPDYRGFIQALETLIGTEQGTDRLPAYTASQPPKPSP